MILYCIKKVAVAGLLVGLMIFVMPQRVEAMTIGGQRMTLKTYFQGRDLSLVVFRVPLFSQVVYANSIEEERERLLIQEARAVAIDRFLRARNMPLAEYSAYMVARADEYGIDWRLLPALSIRESSGGKFSCGNNPFGWASCRIDFESIEEAINVVAWNLGGYNPNTASYYRGDTFDKLHSYNGTVIPRYPAEVARIMERIASDVAVF